MFVFFCQLVISFGVAAALFSFAKTRIKQLPLLSIPGPRSSSFLAGNLEELFDAASWPFHDRIFQLYGRVIRVSGVLGGTHLVISDPRACSSILVKEEDVFEEAEWVREMNRHTFGLGLVATTGAHHRKQRKLLNPVFSATHIRSLTPLFHSVTRQLHDILDAEVSRGPQEIDIVDWLGRLALELVAQGGLGHSFKTLSDEGKNNGFSSGIKEFMPTLSRLAPWATLLPLVKSFPPKFLRTIAGVIPSRDLHRCGEISDIIYSNAKTVFEEKKKVLQEQKDAEAMYQVGEGKDIISTVLKANENASPNDRLPDEEVLAQMATILFGGTDTTSSVLVRIFQLLSENPEAQEQLRQELKDAHIGAEGNELSYNELFSLPYLEAVARETLRLYPPVPIMNRTCRTDISIPLSQPISTSKGIVSSLFIPGGTEVFVNIRGINRDPSIWGEDAVEWKPERWLKPLPESVEQAHIPGIYSHTLSFLAGSRACIGFKFAQLELKVVIAQLIRSFRFSPSTREVIWKFGIISTPAVNGSSEPGAHMPIIIEKI